MVTVSSYFRRWRLGLSKTKIVSTAFHLNNKEAKRELNIIVEGGSLPYNTIPTFVGVKLDRTVTCRHHLETLRKKVT